MKRFNSLGLSVVLGCSLIQITIAKPFSIEQTTEFFGVEKFQHDNISEFERMNY